MQQLRLFWAINLPVPVKSQLAGIQSKLRDVPCNVKWVEEKNLHLTLKFLGNVEISLLTTLVETIKKALQHTSPFTLNIGELGFFPNALSPRVLWTGLQGDLARLQQVYRHLAEAHIPLGFPADKHSFSPHLTLARLRSSGREVNSLVSRVNELNPVSGRLGRLEVKSVDLMQSELGQRGPVYTQLAEVKLKP